MYSQQRTKEVAIGNQILAIQGIRLNSLKWQNVSKITLTSRFISDILSREKIKFARYFSCKDDWFRRLVQSVVSAKC